MKVLQVVEPGVDGVFRHVEGLTRFLSGHGVQVSLAYSDVRGSQGLRRLVDEVRLSGGKTLNLAVGNKPSLIDVFAAIPDFRQPRGTRHPFSAIFALACCAMLCGYRS